MPDHEIVMLAALIADGSLTERTPRFCFGPDSPVLDEVQEAAAAFGLRLRTTERWARDRHDQRWTRRQEQPGPRVVRASRSLGPALRREVRPRRHLRSRRGPPRALPRGALRVRRPCLRQRSPAPDRLLARSASGSPSTSSTCSCASASSRASGRCAARSTTAPTRSRARCSSPARTGSRPSAAGSASAARARSSRAWSPACGASGTATNVDTVPPAVWERGARGEGRSLVGRRQRCHEPAAQPQLARRNRAVSRARSSASSRRRPPTTGCRRSPPRTCGGTRSPRSSRSASRRPSTSPSPAITTSSPTTWSSTTARWSPTWPRTSR